MDFSKYIMDDIVVLSMMYTVSQVRYTEPLIVLKPSKSRSTPRHSLGPALLPSLAPYRSRSGSSAMQQTTASTLEHRLVWHTPEHTAKQAGGGLLHLPGAAWGFARW